MNLVLTVLVVVAGVRFFEHNTKIITTVPEDRLTVLDLTSKNGTKAVTRCAHRNPAVFPVYAAHPRPPLPSPSILTPRVRWLRQPLNTTGSSRPFTTVNVNESFFLDPKILKTTKRSGITELEEVRPRDCHVDSSFRLSASRSFQPPPVPARPPPPLPHACRTHLPGQPRRSGSSSHDDPHDWEPRHPQLVRALLLADVLVLRRHVPSPSNDAARLASPLPPPVLPQDSLVQGGQDAKPRPDGYLRRV